MIAIAGTRGDSRRTFISGVRSSLSGLGLLLALALLLIVSLSIQEDVGVWPTATLVAALLSLAQKAGALAVALLPLLPLLVVALNRAPDAQRLRVAWLVAAAIAYGLAATAIDPGTNELPNLILFALVLTGSFEFQHRVTANEKALSRALLDATALDAEMSRARLQLLHAQIEPHFLFNTLANVRQLARSDTKAATRMIDNLMQYFAAALPNLRTEETTLAQEAELLHAYLAIHRIRIGERLTYEIAFPPELKDARVPTMMLLTLVENAIKHGINPMADGGAVSIRATRKNADLEITVVDSGRGMTAIAGSGTGLANIRSRLALLYGNGAALSLSRVQPRGVAATITIPASVGA